MKLSAVVAMSINRVIGIDNKLPWHLPADLKHFKEVTMGKPILMGRKTYESIGRPLPGRRNLVVTQNPHFVAPGCEVFHSIEEALGVLSDQEEVMVIGGAALFMHLMPRIDTIYLTCIDHMFAGDTFFPEINENDWTAVKKEDHQADGTNPYDYSFILFRRIR